MISKEPVPYQNYNPFQENPIPNHHILQEHNTHEAEDDTLSLSDLQIYTDASSEEFYFSSESKKSFDQDFFGFFSEEWNNTIPIDSSKQPDSIIFCGKLIPPKKPISKTTQNPKPSNQIDDDRQKTRRLFRWNSDKSFCKRFRSGSKPKKTPRSKSLPVPERSRHYVGKYAGKNDLTSPRKSRWYIFLFGSGKFPTKMELSDMRSRQTRKSPSTMFRLGGGDEAVIGGGGKGFRGFIRALGCGGGYPMTSAVKASFGYIPPV